MRASAERAFIGFLMRNKVPALLWQGQPMIELSLVMTTPQRTERRDVEIRT